MKKQELDDKFNLVHNYFRSELCCGNFQVIEIKEHTIILEVKGYIFSIWHANGSASVRTYSSYGEDNTMDINFRVNDKKRFYSKIKPHVKKWKKDTLFDKKTRELEKLKQELEEL